MTDDGSTPPGEEDPPDREGDFSADREEPVGAPVVRGDPEITGAHASEAMNFDPDDPESLAEAAAVVREFADPAGEYDDRITMLRGAAACMALVRGTGSYRAAVERAGDPVTVNFVRKWTRVHDLPISIRRHIALGDIVPTAAQEIARVSGNARFVLAWAVLDHDLTVDEVRRMASAIADGDPVEDVLREFGVTPGRICVTLPLDAYRELRRHACLDYDSPDEVVTMLVEDWLDGGA